MPGAELVRNLIAVDDLGEGIGAALFAASARLQDAVGILQEALHGSGQVHVLDELDGLWVALDHISDAVSGVSAAQQLIRDYGDENNLLLTRTGAKPVLEPAPARSQPVRLAGGPPAEAALAELLQRRVALWPRVDDEKLRHHVFNLFKGTKNTNRIGDGTTMDAIRNERLTEQQTNKSWHRIKGGDELRGLRKSLKAGSDLSAHDRATGTELAEQLRSALEDPLW